MKRLNKFLKLTSDERLLLIKAAFLLGVIRVGLKLLPFQRLRYLLAELSQPVPKWQEKEQISLEKVVWAIYVVSPYISGVRCLAQALATQVMLGRRSYPCELRIGFVRGKNGQMSAHAWVESQGKVAIGGTGNMTRYIPVPIQEVGSEQEQRWFLLS